MLREWNSTTLTLVPKIPSPSMAKDFRPIACCNVVYKVITNILAHRMQSVLPLVIGLTQSAFIKGRSIVDNVLLMHELIRNYHRDVGMPRCAIKIDLMKAYDSVDWNFLLDTTDAMGFPSLFIGWIKECVTTPMYSVMLNGGLVGYFPGAKGLRQGDPISPYLFLLVMEGFSSLLQFNIENGNFKYHPKCQELCISHAMFADDLFVLCRAHEGFLRVVMNALKDFHQFSGLQPNLLKSSVLFSSVSTTLKQSLVELLGISEGQLPVKYLGVPLISSRLTSADCLILKEKILARIQSWA